MRSGRSGRNLFLVFLMNLFLRYRWSIPAWLLLAAHFAFGTPLWLFFLALAFWIVYALGMTGVMHWANRCGNIPNPQRKNINPYSPKNEDFLPPFPPDGKTCGNNGNNGNDGGSREPSAGQSGTNR